MLFIFLPRSETLFSMLEVEGKAKICVARTVSTDTRIPRIAVAKRRLDQNIVRIQCLRLDPVIISLSWCYSPVFVKSFSRHRKGSFMPLNIHSFISRLQMREERSC